MIPDSLLRLNALLLTACIGLLPFLIGKHLHSLCSQSRAYPA